MIRKWKIVIAAVVGLLLLQAYAQPRVALASLPAATTPIQHIVFVIQENRAFDNLFGTFPGLSPGYALNLNTCIPTNLANPSGPCIKPINVDKNESKVNKIDLNHDVPAADMAYDKGKMDGFYAAQVAYYCGPNAKIINKQCLKNVDQFAQLTMEYYTGATLGSYWDLASYYTLDANFFSSMLGASLPNHLYSVAAQSGGIQYNNYQFTLTFQNIGNVMSQYGVTWKYYSTGWMDNYDCVPMTTTITSYLNTNYQFNPFWSPMIYFPATQTGQSTCHNQQNLNDFFKNVSNGYLPQVSWVVPNASYSDHTGALGGANGLQKGQEYVSSVIDAIESQPSLWANTAIFLTWDDWGGFYDNVVPNQVDKYGFGMRVPLIIISPYSSHGGITYGLTGKQTDFTSFLTTIEQNWNLPSLTTRDANQYSLLSQLNFSQSPLAPMFLPTTNVATYPYSTCSLCSFGAGTLTYPLRLPLSGDAGVNMSQIGYFDLD